MDLSQLSRIYFWTLFLFTDLFVYFYANKSYCLYCIANSKSQLSWYSNCFGCLMSLFFPYTYFIIGLPISRQEKSFLCSRKVKVLGCNVCASSISLDYNNLFLKCLYHFIKHKQHVCFYFFLFSLALGIRIYNLKSFIHLTFVFIYIFITQLIIFSCLFAI